MDSYDWEFVRFILVVAGIAGGLIAILFIGTHEAQNKIDENTKLRTEQNKLLDESYFILTTQEGMTNFDSEIGCKLREVYLKKYQHDWTNHTMKNIAYDKWINECLSKERLQ